jgi:ABC-type multidrug transport system ATPase subunit
MAIRSVLFHLLDQLIECSNVSKTYHGEKDIVALTDVLFSINAGEVIVLIGPTGAGKSTLMNILAGAIEPSEGTLRLAGGPPLRSSTRFRRFSVFASRKTF